MSNHTEITVHEAQYVDPRAGNDKFYRTFVIGSDWVTQYGRNGAIGTFTKLVNEADADAATKAAEKKFTSKVKKGYDPTRSGVVVFDGDVTADNIHVLDALAATLPQGEAGEVATSTEPVQVAAVDTVLPDATDKVVSALHAVGADTRPAVATDTAPTLPTRPMLASVQPASVVESAMTDHGFVGQLKYDGDRVVVEVRDGQVTLLNRAGEAKVSNVGTAHSTPFTALGKGRWVFDGEVVGRTLVLFDMVLATDGTITFADEDMGFMGRYQALTVITSVLDLDPEAVVVAPVADDLDTEGAKADLLATAVEGKREGIVLRHREGPYEPGRRSTYLIKHKLIKDADVVVTALHPSKQSATLAVHDEDGNLVEVGAASTIGKGDVAVGDVWVVTFLYVIDPAHPRMFQPRLVTRRTDKAASECNLAQFADAGTVRSL